jgi:tripartite ATP-independent transporter DctM subunit
MLGPSMVRQGYPGGFVAALIAGSAVMGPIIPPSVAMLIYAYVYGGGISVGKLFLMGVVPGVLVGIALMALIGVIARRRNFPVSGRHFSIRAAARALRGALLGLAMPVIILGGILGGAFTPTEAGAVAMLYGLVVGLLVLRTLGARAIARSLLVGAKTSAIIYLLLGTSNLVSWILVRNQVPRTLAQWSLDLTSSPQVFLVVSVAVLFVLGLALEAVPIMIMLVPVLAPAAVAYHIDPHHLGLVIVMAVQTALLSPPVALSLYVVATIVKCSMREATAEVWKFMGVVVAITLLAALWPAMPLAIPRLFGF